MKFVARIEKLAFRVALLAALLVALLVPVNVHAQGADHLNQVLHQLDESSKNFHSTSADFVFKTGQTDPVPDEYTEKGTVFYERSSKGLRTTARIHEHDAKPITKVYSYANGKFELYDGAINQVQLFSKGNQFESYLLLGFGASGQDLSSKWQISWIKTETLTGVKTEVLELVARDPAVKKNIVKVTIWMDPVRGVSLKQRWDLPDGAYRESFYFNFKINTTISESEFALPVNKQTTTVSH